jgi:hypothetical protein
MGNRLEEFYHALSEEKKAKVEVKVKRMLKEQYDNLPPEEVNPMRYQVASDMYRILKG